MRRVERERVSSAGIRFMRWPRTVAEARLIQEKLRPEIKVGGGPRRVRLIAGTDLAYRSDGRKAWAAVVLVEFPSGRVVESATASGPPPFPYVPGYLTFREGPLVLRAFKRLSRRPDLCLFDGQGLAHPRRFGLACHLGLLLDLPSIGCAKSLLVGEYREPSARRGSWSPLRLDGDEVGAAVRTRDGVKAIFVSPGHRVSVRDAVKWALATSSFRVPEPIRLAEQLVNRLKREH